MYICVSSKRINIVYNLKDVDVDSTFNFYMENIIISLKLVLYK